MTLDAWAEALLDVVLPSRINAGQPVVFACDDEAVRLAAQGLTISGETAVASLVDALQAEQPVMQDAGFAAAVRAARAFERDPTRPRQPPPHLVALAVTVIAASRMDRDDRHATQAYYARLCELLRIRRGEAWPHVANFDSFVDVGFRSLADWLSSDLGGERGVLRLPGEPNPRLVGVPISQTPLRGRDRRLLGAFFYRQEAALRAGWSPLGLLRRWGGASRLTAPARALLDEPALAPQIDGALRAAFLSWDGTRLDETGARLLPTRLWLLPRQGALWLRLEAIGIEHAVDAVGPDGPIEVPPPPAVVDVPVEWLRAAETTPVRLTLQNENARLPVLSSPTMLFEQHEGLEGVPVASEEPVWVLTADSTLLAGDDREVDGGLPEPWRLIAAVDPSELPGDLRLERPQGPDADSPAEFLGGLVLATGVWLLGYPPALVAEVPEPMVVEVNGKDAGEVRPRTLFDLPDLPEGRHQVMCGEVELEFELRPRGLRVGIGSVRHILAPRQRDARGRNRIEVCGAEVLGARTISAEPKLLVRTRQSLEVLYEDGSVRLFAPPTDPEWRRAAGLAGVGRWEVPNGAKAVAYASSSSRLREIVILRECDVPRTNAALDFAALHADARVVDRTRDRAGGDSWEVLLADLHTVEADG